MSKVLNIKIEISDEVYSNWIGMLMDCSGLESKEDLECFVESGLNEEILENILFE